MLCLMALRDDPDLRKVLQDREIMEAPFGRAFKTVNRWLTDDADRRKLLDDVVCAATNSTQLAASNPNRTAIIRLCFLTPDFFITALRRTLCLPPKMGDPLVCLTTLYAAKDFGLAEVRSH